MGSNVFSGVADQLANKKTFGNIKVSFEQYQAWRHGYLFEALKDQRYGQSFCNQFNIQDNILFYERDAEWANDYIKNYYVDSGTGAAC